MVAQIRLVHLEGFSVEDRGACRLEQIVVRQLDLLDKNTEQRQLRHRFVHRRNDRQHSLRVCGEPVASVAKLESTDALTQPARGGFGSGATGDHVESQRGVPDSTMR